MAFQNTMKTHETHMDRNLHNAEPFLWISQWETHGKHMDRNLQNAQPCMWISQWHFKTTMKTHENIWIEAFKTPSLFGGSPNGPSKPQ